MGTPVEEMKEISLTQGKVAIVDDEDYPKLSQHKWYAAKQRTGNFYAVRQSPRVKGKRHQTQIWMHVVIFGTPKGMETDHINGNGLDNRRENLRVVTIRQNQQNRHQKKSSKYPGVFWSTRSGKWIARMRINGKQHHLGYFPVEGDAGNAYVKGCRELVTGAPHE